MKDLSLVLSGYEVIGVVLMLCMGGWLVIRWRHWLEEMAIRQRFAALRSDMNKRFGASSEVLYSGRHAGSCEAVIAWAQDCDFENMDRASALLAAHEMWLAYIHLDGFTERQGEWMPNDARYWLGKVKEHTAAAEIHYRACKVLPALLAGNVYTQTGQPGYILPWLRSDATGEDPDSSV